MLTSSWEETAGNALRQPPGDRAVSAYRVPEDQAEVYLFPPLLMCPKSWYALRLPLPGTHDLPC